MQRPVDPLADPEGAIRRVYAYVAYRIGDGAAAEDVTSATIERALRYRASYNPRKGEPIAWLLGIARRELETSYRARIDAPEAIAESGGGRSEPFEDDVLGRLDAGQLVGRLAPRDRELLALRFGADLTAKQIAKEVGMKPNAVEVAIHRALERLRDVISPKVAVPAIVAPSTIAPIVLSEPEPPAPPAPPAPLLAPPPVPEPVVPLVAAPELTEARPEPTLRWWEEPYVPAAPVASTAVVATPEPEPEPAPLPTPEAAPAASPLSREDLVARWSNLTRAADPEAPASDLAQRWANLSRGTSPDPAAAPPEPEGHL